MTIAKEIYWRPWTFSKVRKNFENVFTSDFFLWSYTKTINHKYIWTQDLKTRNLKLRFAFLFLQLFFAKLQHFEIHLKFCTWLISFNFLTSILYCNCYFFCYKIYLHGNNLSTLHEHLQTDILPSEFGGTGPAFNPSLWAEPVIHSAMKEVEISVMERDKNSKKILENPKSTLQSLMW